MLKPIVSLKSITGINLYWRRINTTKGGLWPLSASSGDYHGNAFQKRGRESEGFHLQTIWKTNKQAKPCFKRCQQHPSIQSLSLVKAEVHFSQWKTVAIPILGLQNLIKGLFIILATGSCPFWMALMLCWPRFEIPAMPGTGLKLIRAALVQGGHAFLFSI